MILSVSLGWINVNPGKGIGKPKAAKFISEGARALHDELIAKHCLPHLISSRLDGARAPPVLCPHAHVPH
jgi:hypothetical protein